ncbi:MAG: hypothetical protein SGPRY_012753 [Prymnesium sp.]
MATARQGDYKLGKIYATQVLAVQIAFAFLFIAPIVSAAVLVYVALHLAVCSKLLDVVLDVPLIDSGGKLWELAMIYEGYGFVLGQLLLLGVLLQKKAWVGAPFMLVLSVLTIWCVPSVIVIVICF